MKIECLCKKCGKIFYKFPSRILDGRGIFCSKLCRIQWGRGRPNVGNRGKNNGNWKGGISDGYYERLKKKEKCEKCNSTRYLVTHHKNGNHKDNRIKNLEVLCKSCHTLTHNDILFPYLIKDCPQCNNKFRGSNKFCSKICADKSYIKGIKKNCLICGKTFHCTPYFQKQDKKFCSRKCYTRYRRL